MQFIRCFIAIFCALLFSGAGAFAAKEIPCEFRNGLIWLKVSVTGHSGPLNFVLDSGAGVTVLDVKAAQRVGLKLGAPQSVRGAGTMARAWSIEGFDAQVGGERLTGKVLALDLSGVSQGCGRRIDGLIGNDFFQRQIVQIDYARQKVRLLERGEIGKDAVEVLPLQRRGDALCAKAAVGDVRAQWVRVDTGCDSALHWVGNAPSRGAAGKASVGLSTGKEVTQSADVKLGSMIISNVAVTTHSEPLFPGEAGLLGNGILSRFVVTFDAAKGRLFFGKR